MPIELISEEELSGVREDAAQLFVDRCSIVRPSTDSTFDPDTESVTGGSSSAVYTGECSIYPMAARRDTVDILGEGLIYVRQYRVIVPWEIDTVQLRDVVIMIASDDPQLIGRSFEVRDVFKSTILGYRRLTVHETQE